MIVGACRLELADPAMSTSIDVRRTRTSDVAVVEEIGGFAGPSASRPPAGVGSALASVGTILITSTS
jgi:hypothetical protein